MASQFFSAKVGARVRTVYCLCTSERRPVHPLQCLPPTVVRSPSIMYNEYCIGFCVTDFFQTTKKSSGSFIETKTDEYRSRRKWIFIFVIFRRKYTTRKSDSGRSRQTKQKKKKYRIIVKSTNSSVRSESQKKIHGYGCNQPERRTPLTVCRSRETAFRPTASRSVPPADAVRP